MMPRQRTPTLNEIFPTWSRTGSGIQIGGFFSVLWAWYNTHAEPDVPEWLDDPTGTIARQLDLIYHGTIAGEKLISPLVEGMSGGEPFDGSTIQRAYMLCSAFDAVHIRNLNEQWDLLQLQYDPISNYDMTETSTDTHTGTVADAHTGTETLARSGTDTTTHTGTVTDSGSSSGSSGRYGFDSAAAVPSDTSSGTASNTQTLNTSDAQTLNTSDTTTHADTITTTHNTTQGHTLTRQGNIGVTTSQQMIQSSRDLWAWNFYYNYLFPCTDMVLTLPIYSQ